MKHKSAHELISTIHKNKSFIPDEEERKFLEDLSFYLVFENIKISQKQSRRLWSIYVKSEEALNENSRTEG